MKNEDIKGMHVWEGCNREALKLQNRYAKVKKDEEEALKFFSHLEKEKVELRNLEVNNVLNYVRTYASILTLDDVDMYLCHCQNMLSGNIDGTVLEFMDPRERK